MEERKGRFEMLQPWDKLHVLESEAMELLAREFVDEEQDRPLVIFYNDWQVWKKNPIKYLAEKALRPGVVLNLDLYKRRKAAEPEEKIIQDVKAMPHPVVEVVGPASDENFRLMVALARETGKKVFAYCIMKSGLERDNWGHVVYRDSTIEPFGAWHEQINFVIADGEMGLYRQDRQLYLAYHQVDILHYLKAILTPRNEEPFNEVMELISDPKCLATAYRKAIEHAANRKDFLKLFRLMYLDDEVNIKKDGTKWTFSLPVNPVYFRQHRLSEHFNKVELSTAIIVVNM